MTMVQYAGTRRDAKDITECVGTILATPYGSMPYMRDMGITSDVIGRNAEEIEGEYFNQAVDQVETWEERARVSEVLFGAKTEMTEPKVVIEDGE